MFIVDITGNTGPPIYVWTFNGISISDGNKYSGVNTNTLTVMSVEAGDEGFYSCFILVDGQVLVSNAAELSLCKLTCDRI